MEGTAVGSPGQSCPGPKKSQPCPQNVGREGKAGAFLTLETGKDECGASEGRDGSSGVGWWEGSTNTSVGKGRLLGAWSTPHSGSLRGEGSPLPVQAPPDLFFGPGDFSELPEQI